MPRPRARFDLRPQAETLEGRALLTAVGIDPTYGIGGSSWINTPAPTATSATYDNFQAVALQSDGKAVAVGTRNAYSNTDSSSDILVARFNVDGSPDTSFGNGGSMTVPLKAGNLPLDGSGVALTLQSDGKIVVAGTSSQRSGTTPPPGASTSDFAVARINSNGSIDTGFGVNGVRLVNIFSGNGPFIDSSDTVSSVALTPDAKIVAAGTSSAPGSSDFAVIRLKPDGSLDDTFDADGKVTIPFDIVSGGEDRANAVAVQADGKIVVAGSAVVGTTTAGSTSNPPIPSPTTDIAVARLNTDGTLDKSFDGDGKLTIPYNIGGDNNDEANAVSLQGDKIVLAGTSTVKTTPSQYSNSTVQSMQVTRLNANGSLDTSFDGDGKFILNLNQRGLAMSSTASSLVSLDDGSVLVGGSASAPQGLYGGLLVKLKSDGTLDSSYGNGGAAVLANSGSIGSLAIQADGKAIFATYGNLSRTTAPAPRLLEAKLVTTTIGRRRAYGVTLRFNTALNAVLANNKNAYAVRVGTAGRRFLQVRAASYDAATNTVTLALRQAPPRKGILQAIITGAAIVNLDATPLNDGNPLTMTIARS